MINTRSLSFFTDKSIPLSIGEHTLEHYKLRNNSALAQMLRMHGGMDPYVMLTHRAKKQEVLRQEEEADKDPSGFAKTEERRTHLCSHTSTFAFRNNGS
jgi:hypothetical protein